MFIKLTDVYKDKERVIFLNSEFIVSFCTSVGVYHRGKGTTEIIVSVGDSFKTANVKESVEYIMTEATK